MQGPIPGNDCKGLGFRVQGLVFKGLGFRFRGFTVGDRIRGTLGDLPPLNEVPLFEGSLFQGPPHPTWETDPGHRSSSPPVPARQWGLGFRV